jgi:serine phosphatase RsbU (regulator of sigma subunit)
MRCVPFVLETGDVQICKEDLSAEATIDHLLAEVSAFKGNAPQSDDMTCVVLRVEG